MISAKRREVRERRLPEPDLLSGDYGGSSGLEGIVAEEAAGDADSGEDQAQRSKRIDGALAKISSADRELLTGVYLDGRKPDSIDKEMGANPGTTKHRLDRARKRMRRVLGISPAPKRGR